MGSFDFWSQSELFSDLVDTPATDSGPSTSIVPLAENVADLCTATGDPDSSRAHDATAQMGSTDASSALPAMLPPRPAPDTDALGVYDWRPSLGEVVVDSEATPSNHAYKPSSREIIVDPKGTAQVHRRLLNLSTGAQLFGRMPALEWPASRQEREPMRPLSPRFATTPPPAGNASWEPEVFNEYWEAEVLPPRAVEHSAARIESNTTRAPAARVLERSATRAPLLPATLPPAPLVPAVMPPCVHSAARPGLGLLTDTGSAFSGTLHMNANRENPAARNTTRAPLLPAAMPPAPPGPVMLIRSATQPVLGLLHDTGSTFSGTFNVDVECANVAADRLLHTEPVVEPKPPVVHRSKPFVLDCVDVAAGRMQADLDRGNDYSPANSVVLMCDASSSGSESEISTSDSESDDKNLPEDHEGWRHTLCDGNWSVIQKAFNTESTLYYRDARALPHELNLPIPIPNGIWSAIYDHNYYTVTPKGVTASWLR